MSTRRIHATPASEEPRDLGFERQDGMRIQSPTSIARTIAAVLRSQLFGGDGVRDAFEQPLAEHEHPELSFAEHDELWFDFAADTGDGFDATYTLARVLAEPELVVGKANTKRAQLVVFGGDLVYPLPSRRAYRDHVVGPFRAASPVEDDVIAPEAVVLPGLHDSLDGLSAFRSTFAQRGWFGSWRLRQTRSYIAIALPYRYWIWGIDVRFGVDVEPQRKYFTDAARHLRKGDRVIVCGYHPLWQGIGATDADQLQTVNALLAERGAELLLQLSGKRHYYARYEAPSGETRAILSGGGGAFLEDSSAAPERAVLPVSPPVAIHRKECFPSVETSRKLASRGLWRLPVVLAPLALIGGLLWSWSFSTASLPPAHSWSWLEAFKAVAKGGAIAMAIFVLGLDVLLARQDKAKLSRGAVLMAILHTIGHVAAAVTVVMVVGSLVDARPVFMRLTLGAGLSLSTAAVLATYFAIARMFGQHHGELLPTLNIRDWKSFVRMHIDTKGTLRIFAVGIPSVPDNWEFRPKATDGQPWFERSDSSSIGQLVEEIHGPIVIAPNDDQKAAVDSPTPIAREAPYDVFVSYSRASQRWVRAFIDELVSFAAKRGVADLKIFVDTDSLELREYWRTRLLTEVRRCHAFVAVWSKAYMIAYDAERTCYEEYEEARNRGDKGLVFDVRIEDVVPAAIGPRHFSRLENTTPHTLESSPDFAKLCEDILARVQLRRGQAT